MQNEVQIRPLVETECDLVHEMICELADFEKLRHNVEATADSVRDALFGAHPTAEAVLAECNGEAVGFALFFHNYSTFVGKKGLYLEDLYVREPHRRRGIGRALLIHLAGIARERNCGRFEWSVLDWNENAINFYQQLGAEVLPDWRTVRLDAAGIQNLAKVD